MFVYIVSLLYTLCMVLLFSHVIVNFDFASFSFPGISLGEKQELSVYLNYISVVSHFMFFA